NFDFRHPDYQLVYKKRAEAVSRLSRASAVEIEGLRKYYSENIADFINDWGMTYDPRNLERGLPASIPFLLFERQRECVDEIFYSWRNSEDLLIEKCRDMGLSWLAVAIGASLCMFHEGMQVGYGSRKEILVDRIGDPDCLFFKARSFISMTPPQFRPGWALDKHAPHMRVTFPHNGSVMRGEAGNNIGRGGRAGIYFTDEDAFMANGQLVDAALSQNTNCRVSISSVNGMNNSFAERRHSGRVKVFTFRWQSDPRKDQAWYDKQVARLDPVIVAQEIDLSYTASVSGVVCPYEWIEASVDSHLLLGLDHRGPRRGALDVADEGVDKNAFAGAEGMLLEYLDEWSGKGGDIMHTVERTHDICEAEGYDSYRYDADGLGAGVRGDARTVNERRETNIEAVQFRGSGAVLHPKREIPTLHNDESNGARKIARTNEDYFKNRKSQGWFYLRMRFLATYRAITTGELPDDMSLLISLSSKLPLLKRLMLELAQPTYIQDPTGKIVINKAPDGSKSPNLADAVMILFSPEEANTAGGMLLPGRKGR
ncbi:TerL protein, partial [Streptococcus salivarius]